MSLDFEPTLLGVAVYVITVSNINEGLQTVLIVATIVYTIIKINQLLKSQKRNNMVRILRYLANKLETFNNMIAAAWNKWLSKIKM